MKKFKEFVKKIGNKKRCLLSLLLAGLLLFAVLSGLNGSKSAVTEVNAISAPANKNLDLNGVRYSYQTSLKELKNNYGLLNNNYNRRFLMLNVTSESVVNIQFFGQDNVAYSEGLFNSFVQNVETNLENNVKLIRFDNTEVYELTNGFGNTFDIENSKPFYKYTFYEYQDQSIDTLSDFYKISINFPQIMNLLDKSNKNFNSGLMISCTYLKDGLNDDTTQEEFVNNSIIYNIALSKAINYTFNIKRIENYKLKNILICFENSDVVPPNSIKTRIINEFNVFDANGMSENDYISIENVRFIESNEANIISFDSKYLYTDSPDDYPVFKGNVLLSNDKRDEKLIDDMRTILGPKLIFNFDGGGIFGGNFENNKLINSFYLNLHTSGLPQKIIADLDDVTLFNENVLFTYNNILPTQKAYNTYTNQNQLLFLQKVQTLTAVYENTRYLALSAQVEDILYNVNYVGNIEEKDFEEKVQDDLTDLLKTTGVGAAVGLLIGFLVGNPIGGLIFGALIGFAVAIVPLLIDGLQAIFGYDFLSGLYNFFNSITEFFVNIIDKIVGFLLSIITNPFVLVLIVLVAILYIFVIRPKIK